jgi:O-acetyl-ADP-ribose deacetylase (regulator of RNase III)
VTTIAFPAISCGVFGYPLDRAARIAVGQVAELLRRNESVTKVYLVCFGGDVLGAYREAYREVGG